MFSRLDGRECDGRFLLAGDLRGRRGRGGGRLYIVGSMYGRGMGFWVG